MDKQLVVIEQTGPIGIVQLNAPEKLNAINAAMCDQLLAAIETAAAVSRVLILTGAGRAFCSGAALDDELAPRDVRDAGLPLERQFNPLMLKLRNLPIPWIAAVRGAAAGVGASLALAADMVLVSETAVFIEAFARIGLIPDGGACYLLTRTIGRVRAMEMALLAEPVRAAKALEWGLVNRVLPDDQLDAAALELAGRLAKGAPLALQLTRATLWAALDENFEQVLDRERQNQRLAGQSPDFDEGVAAFLEKRAAKFSQG